MQRARVEVPPEPVVPGRLRVVLQAPVRLYVHDLGWLLGHRFLLLTHVGRRTGRTYGTVLEVLRYDPEKREAVVMSGFGRRSDWLMNVRAGGPAQVTIGRRSYRVACRELPPDDGAEVFAGYERRHGRARPLIRAVLSRLLGWHYDGSPSARTRMAGSYPWWPSCRWDASSDPAVRAGRE